MLKSRRSIPKLLPRADGGDLGFFEKGQLSKATWKTPWPKLEKGQVSDVLTMPYGFIILKVEDKHEGGILPFELAQTRDPKHPLAAAR